MGLLGLAQIGLGLLLLLDLEFGEGIVQKAYLFALAVAVLEGCATFLLALALVQLDAPTRTHALGRVLPVSGGAMLLAKVLAAAVLLGMVPWLVRLPWWAFANLVADEWLLQSAFLWGRQAVLVLIAMLLASLVDSFARAFLWCFVLLAGMVAGVLAFEVILGADLAQARQLAKIEPYDRTQLAMWDHRFAVAGGIVLVGLAAVVGWQFVTRRTAASLIGAGAVLALAALVLAWMPGWPVPGSMVNPEDMPTAQLALTTPEVDAAIHVEFRGARLAMGEHPVTRQNLEMDWAVSATQGWMVRLLHGHVQMWATDGPMVLDEKVYSASDNFRPWEVLLMNLIPANTPEAMFDEEARRVLDLRRLGTRIEMRDGKRSSLQQQRTPNLWPKQWMVTTGLRVRTTLKIEVTRVEILCQGPLTENGWQRPGEGAFRILEGRKATRFAGWLEAPHEVWQTGVAATAARRPVRLDQVHLVSRASEHPDNRQMMLFVDGLYRDMWRPYTADRWRTFAGVSVCRMEIALAPGWLGLQHRPTAAPVTDAWKQHLRYAVVREHESYLVQRVVDLEDVEIKTIP